MERLIRSVKTSRFSINGQLTSDISTNLMLEAMAQDIPLIDQIRNHQLVPLDVALCLAVIGLESHEGLGPTLRTSQPLDPRWRPFLLPEIWSEILEDCHETDSLNLSSALLQIFDFWEESHSAAQLSDDKGERLVSAHWHAICHRREPDPGNANYWWARVRKSLFSDALSEIITASIPELGQMDQKILQRLFVGGSFDNKMMVSSALAARIGSTDEFLLRKVQKYEMLFMISASIESLRGSDKFS